jgi:hypothetical protein
MPSAEPSEPAEGIELTPRIQRWVLSSGALIYLGVLSLGILVQEHRAAVRRDTEYAQFIQLGGNEYPVVHQRDFGSLSGPMGVADPE